MDCSTKSRVREIKRQAPDGRPLPKPLRSEQYPEGLPGLKLRVSQDNLVDQVQLMVEQGGGSVRENPAKNLRWPLAPFHMLAVASAALPIARMCRQERTLAGD